MLKKLIEECFGDLREQTPEESKQMFGNIWAVLASKRLQTCSGSLFLSWRELSARLAEICNEWHGTHFTTDAFLKVKNPDTPIGADQQYDYVVYELYRHSDVIGIFRVKGGTSIASTDEFGVYSEIDIMSGEQHFYRQPYKNGKPVSAPQKISADEYNQFCYSR